METIVVITNKGIFEITGNADNPNEYFAKKLQKGEATIHRAIDLQKAHGMVFPDTEPESLILCEEDTGRWYIVEMAEDIIIGFEEIDYIEGFNAEEVEAIRTKGFFRDGDAYYITGKELAKEESVRDHELDENAVYYWDDGVDYICHLDELERASRIPS